MTDVQRDADRWVPTAKNSGTAGLHPLLCAPCFKRGFISVIGMRPHMVICDIGEFFHCLIQGCFFPEFIQVCAFVLQCVEISLHRGIVVWVSGLAHALEHMDGFAKPRESFRCIPAPLVTVQHKHVFCR